MRLALAPCTTLLAGLVSAQSTLVIPTVAQAADGNSSSIWPFDVATMRIQYIYDSTHFTGNGVSFPIVISQIRFRANAATATWTGSAATLQMDLSTAPFDHSAITSTFATNHGADQTTVFNGPWSIPAGSSTTGVPGPFYATVTFTTPFRYDPAAGDLTIDTTHSGITIANTPVLDAVSTTGAALAHRMQTTTIGSPTGAIWSGELANALEFTYTPANGLFAAFNANVTAGPSPLNVTFTDHSFSSDPGGITGWAWDFNGDNVTDSTQQNPTFVYTGCGNFNVSLTVTDATHSPNTMTLPAYIATDNIVAGFGQALMSPPNVFQFTDTTTPAATAWDWDINGDNIPDSTLPNPVFVLPLCQASTVRLLATRNCRTSTATQAVFAAPNSLTTSFNGNNILSAAGATVMFDATIANPTGINICALDHNTGTLAVGSPFTVDVYVTPTSWAGNDNNIAPWRLVATGTGIAQGNNVPSSTALASPLYLPAGSYGIALVHSGPVRYTGTTSGGPPVVFSNSDLTLTLGAVRSTVFNGGSFFQIRQWNGTVHYDTLTTGASAGYGFFGAGCAGSLGITNLNHTSRPQIGGPVAVNLNHLPQSVAIFMIGLSNTISPFGPLPLDLTPLGAPGCSGRVSPDVSSFLIGAGNAASWSFGVPNNGALIGMLLYNQALVLDPGFNALGAVLSDATGMMVGN